MFFTFLENRRNIRLSPIIWYSALSKRLIVHYVPFMEDIVVTKEGVTKLLKGLNPSKALGPDELHPRRNRIDN